MLINNFMLHLSDQVKIQQKKNLSEGKKQITLLNKSKICYKYTGIINLVQITVFTCLHTWELSVK